MPYAELYWGSTFTFTCSAVLKQKLLDSCRFLLLFPFWGSSTRFNVPWTTSSPLRFDVNAPEMRLLFPALQASEFQLQTKKSPERGWGVSRFPRSDLAPPPFIEPSRQNGVYARFPRCTGRKFSRRVAAMAYKL